MIFCWILGSLRQPSKYFVPTTYGKDLRYTLCLPPVGMALCCMKMAQDRLEECVWSLHGKGSRHSKAEWEATSRPTANGFLCRGKLVASRTDTRTVERWGWMRFLKGKISDRIKLRPSVYLRDSQEPAIHEQTSVGRYI